MRLRKNIMFMTTLLSILLLNSVSIAADPQPVSQEQQEFLQDCDSFQALVQTRDLERLEKLAAGLETKWFGRNKEKYGYIMLKICGVLSSYDFETDRRHDLERKYARLALEKSAALEEENQIPIEVELRLLGHVQTLFKFKEAAKSKDWSTKRAAMAKLYFHALNRLEKAIDKNWDPNDTSLVGRPPVPAGVDAWVSGMSPQSIKDPNIRAEYVAALENYWEKVRKYNEQRSLHQLKESRLPYVQEGLLRLYSGPSFDSKKLEIVDLQQDLERHIEDKEVRTTILNQVQKKLTEKSKPKPEDKQGGWRRSEGELKGPGN